MAELTMLQQRLLKIMTSNKVIEQMILDTWQWDTSQSNDSIEIMAAILLLTE